MGGVASYFFVDPVTMTGGQLVWAGLSYGYMLFQAANLISDGSECLMLIPSYQPFVGPIVLPVLGAVPDAMIMLFSGLGALEDAQYKISVGIGALAGSTIMLLTIPWVASIYVGRVDIEKGVCDYKKRPKLENNGLTNTGIEANKTNRVGAYIMAATSLCYLVIQVPAYGLDNQVRITNLTVAQEELSNIRSTGAAENLWALAGSIICFIGFAGYLYLQWLSEQQGEEEPKDEKEAAASAGEAPMVIKTNSTLSSIPVPGRKMSCTPERMLDVGNQNSLLLYLDDFRKTNSDKLRSGMDQGLIESVEVNHNLMSMLRTQFKRYSCREEDDRLLDRREFETLFSEMKLGYSHDEIEEQFRKADVNNDKHVNFNEFVRCFVNLAANPPKPKSISQQSRVSHSVTLSSSLSRTRGLSSCKEETQEKEDEDYDEDDESEEEDDDFKDLEPDERKRRILLKSFYMMGLGTFIVLLFSDPMTDVLAAIGGNLGISPFYVSFVLAPIASNASELTASLNFASKKTKKSITTSLDQLLGAGCCNNTFCLGVFLALIYFQGLSWKFTAETIATLVVEWIMFVYVLMKQTQTLQDGLCVLTLYPLSLLFVWFLENPVGLD